MSGAATLSSRQIRDRLDHPVIDVDGHLVEVSTCLKDDVLAAAREMGGPGLLKRVERTPLTFDDGRLVWASLTDAARRDEWAACMAWRSITVNTLDRASAHVPAILHERLEGFGIDYSVLFPSLGFAFARNPDEDIRRLACRVFNTTTAEMYRPYADRLTPVALIPMWSPDEAIEALDHAVVELGSKAIVIGVVHRPVPKVARELPAAVPFARRVESFGIDSEYDYDPFWQRCVDLKVSVCVHHTEQGYGSRQSPSRYVYNHIGSFAAGNDSICKSLFLGGVTRRFPTLPFAFLEGGMGWATALLSDLISHWEKRSAESITSLDPARLDLVEMERLIRENGPESMTGRMERVMEYFEVSRWQPDDLDDWRSCGITTIEDFKSLFIQPFFFGCEADDRLNLLAFDTRLNPFGSKLQAVFGSDIGHWDVGDMTTVLREAYELVDDGLVDAADFRDLVFTNPVKLFAGAKPDFFAGTSFEPAVADVLGSPAAGGSPPAGQGAHH